MFHTLTKQARNMLIIACMLFCYGCWSWPDLPKPEPSLTEDSDSPVSEKKQPKLLKKTTPHEELVKQSEEERDREIKKVFHETESEFKDINDKWQSSFKPQLVTLTNSYKKHRNTSNDVSREIQNAFIAAEFMIDSLIYCIDKEINKTMTKLKEPAQGNFLTYPDLGWLKQIGMQKACIVFFNMIDLKKIIEFFDEKNIQSIAEKCIKDRERGDHFFLGTIHAFHAHYFQALASASICPVSKKHQTDLIQSAKETCSTKLASYFEPISFKIILLDQLAERSLHQTLIYNWKEQASKKYTDYLLHNKR